MPNFKWGIIAGGGALILSLIVGGISGIAFLHVLIRAVILMAVFFALGIGSNMVIVNFIPDLLEKDTLENSAAPVPIVNRPGSRINITLGEGGAVPEMYQKPGDTDEIGDIADLKSGSAPAAPPAPAGGGLGDALDTSFNNPEEQGLDQLPQDSYTEGEQSGMAEIDLEDSGAGFEPSPAFNGSVFTTGVSEGDLGGLPDLDAMAGAFSIDGGEGNSVETEVESFLPERKPSGNKTQGFDGDFNPKELAAGIRTVLEKDKKG